MKSPAGSDSPSLSGMMQHKEMVPRDAISGHTRLDMYWHVLRCEARSTRWWYFRIPRDTVRYCMIQNTVRRDIKLLHTPPHHPMTDHKTPTHITKYHKIPNQTTYLLSLPQTTEKYCIGFMYFCYFNSRRFVNTRVELRLLCVGRPQGAGWFPGFTMPAGKLHVCTQVVPPVQILTVISDSLITLE